jgi:hypothetical protein
MEKPIICKEEKPCEECVVGKYLISMYGTTIDCNDEIIKSFINIGKQLREMNQKHIIN